MKYCIECGHALRKRELEHEGCIPYCEQCKEYRFPIFSTAISMIVLNPKKDKVLLIQQYQKVRNVLVAGYVNKSESLEEALIRELKEEVGLDAAHYQYMKSEYFEKTNTLMCNFAVVASSENLENMSEWEIDKAQWYSFEAAKKEILQGSLAHRFLLYFFKQVENKKYSL